MIVTRGITFLHAADLHLDSPFKGLARVPEEIFKEITQSTFVAFERLVETAITKQVDFILLAGDLFDNERQSLKAQIKLRDLFTTLKHYHIQVFLSHGNHDYTNGNRYPITYPDNVSVFPDETVRVFPYERNGEKLASVYGFSYENQAVLSKKVKEFVPQGDQTVFHIAMLHGSTYTNTEHDTYAPFALADLQEKNFDYWALGHIHKRSVLTEHPPAIYPGNIQGRHRKESGEKGCYYVELSETGANYSFIPLQSIRFETLTVDISDCTEAHQLEEVLQRKLQTLDMSDPQLMMLSLSTSVTEHNRWEADGVLDEVIEWINEAYEKRSNWIYIYRYQLKKQAAVTEETLQYGEHFAGELLRYAETSSVRPFVSELYQHKEARKYLQSLTANDEKNLKQEAKQYLLKNLLYEEGE